MFLIEVKHSGYCAAINTRVTVRGDGRDAFARRYSMRAMVLPVPHGLLWEKRRWRKEPPCFNPDLIPDMIDPTAQDAATQRDVLVFLATLTTYGGADVRRIGTHAAVVFLAGDRVLKVKRAIRFPFLDYSHWRNGRWPVKKRSGLITPPSPTLRAIGGRQQQSYDIGPLDWHIIDASGTIQQTLRRCSNEMPAKIRMDL